MQLIAATVARGWGVRGAEGKQGIAWELTQFTRDGYRVRRSLGVCDLAALDVLFGCAVWMCCVRLLRCRTCVLPPSVLLLPPIAPHSYPSWLPCLTLLPFTGRPQRVVSQLFQPGRGGDCCAATDRCRGAAAAGGGPLLRFLQARLHCFVFQLADAFLMQMHFSVQ